MSVSEEETHAQWTTPVSFPLSLFSKHLSHHTFGLEPIKWNNLGENQIEIR
jgi:hypothetical protein